MEETLTLEQLKATVARLNKRCQRAESLAAKWKRRYVSIQRPAEQALERAHAHAQMMYNLHYLVRTGAKKCWWCGSWR